MLPLDLITKFGFVKWNIFSSCVLELLSQLTVLSKRSIFFSQPAEVQNSFLRVYWRLVFWIQLIFHSLFHQLCSDPFWLVASFHVFSGLELSKILYVYFTFYFPWDPFFYCCRILFTSQKCIAKILKQRRIWIHKAKFLL